MVRTRRERAEKAAGETGEEPGAKREEERATGPSGHRGPSPGELLVGCRSGFFRGWHLCSRGQE